MNRSAYARKIQRAAGRYPTDVVKNDGASVQDQGIPIGHCRGIGKCRCAV
jgi:hypothetical protein